MVRVLPVPAPARMHTGPRTATAAARCSSSSPASTASAPVSASLSSCPATPGVPTHPILPAPADDPGKHPQTRDVRMEDEPAAPPSSWGGRPGQERGRIPLDERLSVRGDDVHDRLVRLLRPPEEAHAA